MGGPISYTGANFTYRGKFYICDKFQLLWQILHGMAYHTYYTVANFNAGAHFNKIHKAIHIM